MFKVFKAKNNSNAEESLDTSELESKSPYSNKNNKIFKISTSNNEFLNKKLFSTKVIKYSTKKYPNKNRGLWDKSEHYKFIEALYIYNCDYMEIKNILKERTYNQIISHGQKFFLRLKKFKDENFGLDFTSKHIKNMKDILKIVKVKEKALNLNYRLLFIISEKLSFGKNVKRQNNEKVLLSTKENEANLSDFQNENSIDSYNNDINSWAIFNKETEEKCKENVNINPFELNNISSDEDIEKEVEDIFTLNIYNNNNELICLKKLFG